MKIILIVLLVAGGVVAAARFGIPQKIQKISPSLPQAANITLPKLPNLHVSKIEEEKKEEKVEDEKNGEQQRDALQGKVAGIATSAQNTLQGMGTMFLSTPAPGGSDTINVGTVVNQISKQIEGIPSHLLGQAKVQYCQQVLIEATKSATPTP